MIELWQNTNFLGHKMNHCIGSGVFGIPEILVISQEEFTEIKNAKAKIAVLLGIEEKFQIVIDNFLEYERDSLWFALSKMVSYDYDWSTGRDVARLMNQRVSNCLSAVRLYIDQLRHDLSALYGKGSASYEAVDHTRRAQYDRFFGYRVMEAIRNLLQHRQLPVTGSVLSAGWEDRNEGSQLLHHRFVAMIEIENLRDDKEFKKEVLDQLNATGNKRIEVSPLLRQYIDGLGNIHRHVREVTLNDAVACKELLTNVLERYNSVASSKVKVALAYKLENDEVTDQVAVFLDACDRLERFCHVPRPTNISRAFVSNEPLEQTHRNLK